MVALQFSVAGVVAREALMKCSPLFADLVLAAVAVEARLAVPISWLDTA